MFYQYFDSSTVYHWTITGLLLMIILWVFAGKNKSDDGNVDPTEKEGSGEEREKKSYGDEEKSEETENNGDGKEGIENKKNEKDRNKGQKKDNKKKEDPLKDSPYNKSAKRELDTATRSATKVKDERKKGKK